MKKLEFKFGHDESVDFLKEENISPKEKRKYDVVVVGCGSAGIPCAVRLHELEKKL